MGDPSAAVTFAEAAAIAGDATLKFGWGMSSRAWFQKGVVSLTQVLCDQTSRMDLGVTWNSPASIVATVGPGWDLYTSSRRLQLSEAPFCCEHSLVDSTGCQPSFGHAHGRQLDTGAACEKKHRHGNGTYLRATKMTTASSRVSLPLTVRATGWTSSCQLSCSASIDQSRSPPVCALVRSQSSVVGRDLHTTGAAGDVALAMDITSMVARATDVEPDKTWSSLCLFWGSSTNCDSARALWHRLLARCSVEGVWLSDPVLIVGACNIWMCQEGSMSVLIFAIARVCFLWSICKHLQILQTRNRLPHDLSPKPKSSCFVTKSYIRTSLSSLSSMSYLNLMSLFENEMSQKRKKGMQRVRKETQQRANNNFCRNNF